MMCPHVMRPPLGRSAGASLRRYNEAALEQDIQELLRSWSELLAMCSVVLLRSSKYNRRIFVGGKGAMFEKGDARLRTIPFATRRPTFSEVQRVHEMLVVVFEGNGPRDEGRKRGEAGPSKADREGVHSTTVEGVHSTTVEKDTKCLFEEDTGNVDKVKGGTKESADGYVGDTGEECSVVQSGVNKTKGKRKKKKGLQTKETLNTEEPSHTEEPSRAIESTQSTEHISTDMQELVHACKAGDMQQLVSQLIKMGLVCASEQDTGVLEEEGSSVVRESENEPHKAMEGKEPLEMAEHSLSGDARLLEVAEADRKALLNSVNDGQTLLHVAAQHGSAGVITKLLHCGADPTIKLVINNKMTTVEKRYNFCPTAEMLLVKLHT